MEEASPFSAIPPKVMAVPARRRRIVAHVKEKGVQIGSICQKLAPAAFEKLFFFGGLASITLGCWMAWHPLGPLVGGSMMFWLSLLISSERAEQAAAGKRK
jgi:hypothetical protein